MNCTKCSRIVSNNGLDICLNCLGGFDNIFGMDDGKYNEEEEERNAAAKGKESQDQEGYKFQHSARDERRQTAEAGCGHSNERSWKG